MTTTTEFPPTTTTVPPTTTTTDPPLTTTTVPPTTSTTEPPPTTTTTTTEPPPTTTTTTTEPPPTTTTTTTEPPPTTTTTTTEPPPTTTTTCVPATTLPPDAIDLRNSRRVDPISLGGCKSPDRQRSVVIEMDSDGVFSWPFYASNGEEVVPTYECGFAPPNLPDMSDTNRRVLFYDPYNSCVAPQPGRITFDSDGRMHIETPESVRRRPGIYLFQIQWQQADGSVLKDRGVMSVEPSILTAFDFAGRYEGPLTITEVRTRLRDFPSANELLEDYEWSVDEILHAIARPVSFWNETPPPTSRYSPSNFPYREHWLTATVATLYLTAAHSMLRNDIQIQAEGVAANDRNQSKWGYMFNYATVEWQQFVAFVHRTKGAENLRGSFFVM
ncbi:MAG: hypothetical protein KatS3mg109_0051 [Pirellulaceae bacterium]|nr:MAG: hypothetical protein KatS3mg109_0051 [Pirellulaceae bacterium]